MMLEDPIEYKINSVRVYQNPDFEEQKVGCSTPERPTRRYIEGHAKLYKKEFEASENTCIKNCVGRRVLIFFVHLPSRSDR
jgi:hypothetical protein